MPVILDDRTFYRTSEVCRKAGISEYRDRRSWRLFTESDVESLINEANRICDVSDRRSEL
jgi:hypothetical protein